MTTTASTESSADTGDDPAITIYRLQGCPYCERIVRQLDELGLAYHSRFVEPLHSRRNAVKRVAGVRTVPVLVDERTGVTMAESANIAAYLEATYESGRVEVTDESETASETSASNESSASNEPGGSNESETVSHGEEAPAGGGE